jgi:hypothetical protein
MRRVLRLDVSNYNKGEQSSPALLFNMSNPLAPDLIYDDVSQDSSVSGDSSLHDRGMYAAEGYDQANNKYKRGVVLRSKITCEWHRRPIPHQSGMTSAADHGTAAGALPDTDKVMLDSQISYEPSPAAYLITQIGQVDQMWGYPQPNGTRNWGNIEPPFLNQPKNPAMGGTVALLTKTQNRDNQLKFRLCPEARTSKRHTVSWIYDRSKFHKKGAHAAMDDLESKMQNDQGVVSSVYTSQDEDSDAFYFTRATQSIPLTTGSPWSTKSEGIEHRKHPRSSTTFRVQMMPEDTAPVIKVQSTGAAKTQTDADDYGVTKKLVVHDKPPAKALGQGTLNVVIDYIVLCSDPYTSEEYEILRKAGAQTLTEEQSAMDTTAGAAAGADEYIADNLHVVDPGQHTQAQVINPPAN